MTGEQLFLMKYLLTEQGYTKIDDLNEEPIIESFSKTEGFNEIRVRIWLSTTLQSEKDVKEIEVIYFHLDGGPHAQKNLYTTDFDSEKVLDIMNVILDLETEYF